MSKKELEARIDHLEQLLIRAFAWIGVRANINAEREYRKVLREVAEIKHEVEARKE